MRYSEDWRDEDQIPDTDGIEEMREDFKLKRARASGLSNVHIWVVVGLVLGVLASDSPINPSSRGKSIKPKF